MERIIRKKLKEHTLWCPYTNRKPCVVLQCSVRIRPKNKYMQRTCFEQICCQLCYNPSWKVQKVQVHNIVLKSEKFKFRLTDCSIHFASCNQVSDTVSTWFSLGIWDHLRTKEGTQPSSTGFCFIFSGQVSRLYKPRNAGVLFSWTLSWFLKVVWCIRGYWIVHWQTLYDVSNVESLKIPCVSCQSIL